MGMEFMEDFCDFHFTLNKRNSEIQNYTAHYTEMMNIFLSKMGKFLNVLLFSWIWMGKQESARRREKHLGTPNNNKYEVIITFQRMKKSKSTSRILFSSVQFKSKFADVAYQGTMESTI